jgi:hypothetical protein
VADFILNMQPIGNMTMENQHRKIKGYRELSQPEIDLMNEIKEKAAEVGELVEKLETLATPDKNDDRWFPVGDEPDLRWVESGKTDLQKGFMALTRSIAKPGFF